MIERLGQVTAGVLVVRLTYSDTVHLLPMQPAPLDGCNGLMTYQERTPWWQLW